MSEFVSITGGVDAPLAAAGRVQDLFESLGVDARTLLDQLTAAEKWGAPDQFSQQIRPKYEAARQQLSDALIGTSSAKPGIPQAGVELGRTAGSILVSLREQDLDNARRISGA